MKISGIAVRNILDGTVEVSVSAVFDQRESLEPTDVARILDSIREAAGSDKPAPETAGPTSERRSRRSSGAEPASATENATAAATDAPGRRRRSSAAAPEPEVEAAPLARRRRSGTAAGTAEPSEATRAAETAPASTEGRRRRGAAEAAPEAVPTEGRRRRGAAPAAEPQEKAAAPATRSRRPIASAAASEISDADLSKAASECARICTPAVVKDILKDFHVDKVGDIKPVERQEFLDECAGAIKEAE